MGDRGVKKAIGEGKGGFTIQNVQKVSVATIIDGVRGKLVYLLG